MCGHSRSGARGSARIRTSPADSSAGSRSSSIGRASAFADDRDHAAPAARRGEPERRRCRYALVPARFRSGARRGRAGGGRHLPGRDAARNDPRQRRRAYRSKARVTDAASASRAGFVVDASGPRGFLTTALGTGGAPPRWLPPTQGLFTHFEDVDLLGTTSCRRTASPPYPPDAAALHHVFPGGWIWVLRFNNGITSAGAALTDPLAAQLGRPRARRRGTGCSPCLPRSRDHFRRRARDDAVHARAARGVSLPRSRRRQVGAAAVGSGRDRPAALDRIPADAARPRPALEILETTRSW